MGPLVFAAVTFALLWVLFILPQQRRIRAHQGLVDRLAAGDDVVTNGGLFGTIADLDDEVVQLEVAPGTVVRVARGHITRRLIEEIEEAEEQSPIDGPPSDATDPIITET